MNDLGVPSFVSCLPPVGPNNSFKPNLLRYGKGMAEKACHAFASTTQVGLTQALGLMSHIVISTQDGISNTQLVHALGTCVPGGIGHIASSLRNGTPLFDGELFQGPRLEQFTRVRRLLAILQDFGVEPFVWESGHPISARILLNIMQASDDSAAEFERLSDLGHEA